MWKNSKKLFNSIKTLVSAVAITAMLSSVCYAAPISQAGNIPDNTILVNHDLYQLDNTNGYTRDNVLDSLSNKYSDTNPEAIFYKYNNYWYDLSKINGLKDFNKTKADDVDATVSLTDLRKWYKDNTKTAYPKTFDLVGITDFHGQLLDTSNTVEVGAAFAKTVKDVKAQNPDRTLIIGGGDFYQGTPVSNVLYGVPVQQVMTNIGMEVTALGNHEFDWGLDKIVNTTMKGASYSIVCANLHKKNSDGSAGDRVFAPYKIITKDGVRIAVIGAISNGTPDIVLPANIKDLKFTDATTEVNAMAKEIRDGNKADVVIATIHEGNSDLNAIVNKLHGVDAVFGGHSHSQLDTVLQDADGKNVPTVNAKNNAQAYVDLKMTINADKTISFSAKGTNYKAFSAKSTTPVDDTCKGIVDSAFKDLAPIFNEVIGTTDKAYTKDQVSQPYGECQLGNWMADVVKNYVNADVGMVNNGGIRISPVPAGNITVGTIFNLMPFDNTVCSVKMTGAQLKILLEQAVQDNGKGVQISGVKFTYDASKQSYKPAVLNDDGSVKTPAVMGQRVTKIVRESDGTVIKDTDPLTVAAPDFLATGGDTFTEFVDDAAIKASFVNTYDTVRDALIKDVRANKTIKVVMDNRLDNQTTVVPPTEMSISDARKAASGSAILTGVVSAVNGNNVFIQDSETNPTAGICVYNSGGKVFTAQKGDKIKVTGPISVYNKLIEITPKVAGDVVKISSGTTVTPKEVKVSDITSALQGQLIKIKNAKFTTIDNTGASMAEDSTGTVNVFKMPKVDGLAVGDTADIIAAVTQYNDTIELAVDSAADIVKTGTAPVAQTPAISIVATSDVHGNVLNYDYATGQAPSKGQGLAKVSTYVNNLRASNPNVMLVDNGDTMQGTPLVYYYNMKDQKTLYPMMAAMGAMKYDTWTLGNHEFNYGLDTLNRVINDAKSKGITVLSANTYNSDNTNFVKPYYTKTFTVKGKTIKVGILGLTTKCIPNWEDPAHYAGLHFNDLVTEAQKWVPILKNTEKADVVIVTAHSGEEGASDVIPENQIKALAQGVSGIDAIVAGHVHNTVLDNSLKNPDGKVVPVVEPNKWATNVSQVDINADDSGNVTGVTAKNVAMDKTIAEDPAIVSLIQPYQDATLAYINTVLGTSTGKFEGAGQTTNPTAIMELINKVQMEGAKTQLSIAAPLSASALIPSGDITIKDVMSVYVFENFLYGVKMTGKQLKDWMEFSVRYYGQVSSANDSIVKDSKLNVPDYNLDQLYGATYDVDLTQPACTVDSNGRVVSGNRIKNLKFNGKLVKDTDVFTVAINNYRYNGGGGFMAAAGLSNTDSSIVTYDSAKALGDDGQVRSMMQNYIQTHKTINPDCSNNWKLYTTPVQQETDGTKTIQSIKSTKMIKVTPKNKKAA